MPPLWLVSKSRKVTFDATCTLHELDNVPYISGMYYGRWKLKQGGTSKGSTQRTTVKDHKVTWNFPIHLQVTMVIGKDGMLEPCELGFHLRQEVNAGKTSESIGRVTVNLAEYAGARSTTRRYLLQESRINSFIRITVTMTQRSGNPIFTVPSPDQRDVFTDSLRLVDEQAPEREGLSLTRILAKKTSREGLDDKVETPLFLQQDDAGVDFVNNIFQQVKRV